MKNTLKIYKPSLEWYVYRMDYTTKKIVAFNIFENSRFKDEVKKINCMNKDIFSEKLRGLLFYYYAAKCEYEVGITSWPPCAIDEETKEPKIYKKIDIYQQVRLNWKAFVDYVWDRSETIENT